MKKDDHDGRYIIVHTLSLISTLLRPNRGGVTSIRKITSSGSYKGTLAFLSPLTGPLESLWDLTSRSRTPGVDPGVESLEA